MTAVTRAASRRTALGSGGTVAGLVVLLAALGRCMAQDRPGTSWGRVTGQVYDAHTGKPVSGAFVQVRHEGAFAESGKTTGTTDPLGRYSVQAILGRVSQNFDVGRALSSGLVGILTGGATNRTKRLDVTRLPLRVSAAGYKPYVGICPCREGDASRFAVRMEPILLVPASTPEEVSSFSEGWGAVRLRDASVEPSVACPGTPVALKAVVQVPEGVNPRDIEVLALSDLWGRKRLQTQEAAREGAVILMTTLKAPSRRSADNLTVTFVVGRCPVDVAAQVPLRRKLLLSTGEEDALTARRASANQALLSGKTSEALEAWRSICAAPGATPEDYVQLAEVAKAVSDFTTAEEALRRALEISSERQKASVAARHAQALLAAGQAGRVVQSYGSVVSEKRSREQSRLVSPSLLATVGEAFLETGDLAGAQRVMEQLDRLSGVLGDDAIRFRSALRLAQARKACEENPQSAEKQVKLARALLDLGRWEEAMPLLREAALGAARMATPDLAYATRLARPAANQEETPLEEALEKARRAVRVSDGKRERDSKDFYAWHGLAMLLYAKLGERQLAATDRDSVLSECIGALREAVACARAGARIDEGIAAPYVGYLSSRTVAIGGYAYPEAASDFELASALEALRDKPADDVALLQCAAALVELGHPRAGEALEAARGVWSTSPEYQLLLGLWEHRRGSNEQAVQALRRAITLHPRASRAYLELAAILAEDGDMVGSAEVLARHALLFGQPFDPSKLGEEL